MSRKRIVIILIILVAILSLIGGWFYYTQVVVVNYLIPGVPYNGIQNLFFVRRANTPATASVMDILGYWGDERFSVSDLKEKFSPFLTTIPPSTIKNFFEDNGYEVYQWGSTEPSNEIKEIKKFVNSERKIPVIVFQKRSLNTEGPTTGPRVVIGIFDKEKKVVVHDNLLGNNYEISYQDFEKMFTDNSRAILAIWPSEKIKGVIKGPDYSLSYPQRTEAMDKLGPLLTSKSSEASFYRSAGDFEKANASYKDLVDDPNFQYFPRAFQVSFLSAFAQTYIYSNQFDEAIKVIKERVLPLNQNLSEAPEGWSVLPVDKFAYPYYVLSLAYLQNGQKDLAITNYKEMKVLRDLIVEKTNDDPSFAPPQIEELEKEISSKK